MYTMLRIGVHTPATVGSLNTNIHMVKENINAVDTLSYVSKLTVFKLRSRKRLA